jgi:hypothetical protein
LMENGFAENIKEYCRLKYNVVWAGGNNHNHQSANGDPANGAFGGSANGVDLFHLLRNHQALGAVWFLIFAPICAVVVVVVQH